MENQQKTDKTKHDSHNLEDHLGEKFETKAEDGVWTGQELTATSDIINDPGVGHPVLLRQFEYKLNPDLPKGLTYTKQDLFKFHEGQIKTMLWADGLVPLDSIKPPKVQMSKKNQGYRIFVLCRPRETLLDTPIAIT